MQRNSGGDSVLVTGMYPPEMMLVVPPFLSRTKKGRGTVSVRATQILGQTIEKLADCC